MTAAITMWPASTLGIHLVVLSCLRITEAAAPADQTGAFLRLAQQYNPRQSRAFDYSSPSVSKSSFPTQPNTAPFDYSSAGYSVPSGATSLGRSYSGYGNSAPYSAYPSSYSSNTNIAAAVAPAGIISPTSYAQPSLRSFSPYGNDNTPYKNNYYRSNIGNYALSYNRADPAEPDDPTDTPSSKKAFASMSMTPRFNLPANNPGFSPSGSSAGSGNMGPYTSNVGGYLGPVGTSAANSASSLFGARSSAVGSDPASTGAASAYAQSTGYGKEGYAQASPNTASGSVYNPNYGSSSYPSYYGANNKNYGLGGSFSAASLYPFYLYYPVEYGYDQGEQSVMPNGGGYFPLIGYKRRYGYRRGPYYGYGIYVDYPPYFGFGKVKDGWGSDPEADLMAAQALDQGAGASAEQSIQSSSGNSQGGYGGSNGYGNNAQTTGYGSSPSAGSYAAASSAANSGGGTYPTGNTVGTSSYIPATSSSSQYGQQQAYSQPLAQYSQQNYSPSTSDSQNYGSSQQYGQQQQQSYSPAAYSSAGNAGSQYNQGSQYGSNSQYNGASNNFNGK